MPRDISGNAAHVNLEVPVQNERTSDGQCRAAGRRFSTATANRCSSSKQAGAIAAGAHAEFKVSGVVQNPQLWEPAYPYLYRVVCSLRVGGRDVDSREIPLGIRTVRWDVNTGFYINGHHLKLHGWGQKPTDEWPGLGAAQPDWMHFFTLDLMKEAGGNFVRWGHCAGADRP